MTISINDLEVYAIIGILDIEKETPQRIIVDLEASYEYEDRDTFVDYAKIVDMISYDLKKSRYGLLEDAINALAVLLKSEFPHIYDLRISITKPDIIPNCKVALFKFFFKK